MNKRGTTLIETVISIFLISTVVMTFLEALSIGITGTLDLNRKTSALNLAKSQIDYTKARDYQPTAGNLSLVYGSIMVEGNISDTVNYAISGEVTNVSDTQPLQQITVNVSYMPGKEDVQLTAYKTDDGSLAVPAPQGLLVTDVIQNVPTLPQGYSFLCAGQFRGYYHVFTTGTAGRVSVHWKFYWSRVSGTSSMGAPMMAIYEGVPNWVKVDYEGEIREDGLIVRRQNKGIEWLPGVIGIGDLPGPGGGGRGSMCYCCNSAANPDTDCDGESDPIAWAPHSCGWGPFWACMWGGYTGDYPCCGACLTDSAGSPFWSYDQVSDSNGFIEYTLTTTSSVSVGTYTVLFFNAENGINLDTTSASVTFYY